MPLPQKALEQIGREPPKTPGWSRQLLMFSSTVFIFSLLIYFGLAFGYKSYLNTQVQQLQDQIQAFGQQIPLDQQAKIIQFYSQLANLKKLLDNHTISSRIFSWLSKNTQTNVYWTSFSLDSQGGQVSLSGTAKSVADVGQQLAIFQSLPELTSMETNGVSGSGNNWQFSVDLKFIGGYFSASTVNSSGK
ncbi:MAG: hypothetical protein KGJ89_00705 [Patescibacteria group bacterium]|nr:hypothetical protein [Patescibacteria group bacterium]MDE2015034.1 hypothetical protein [Patescibacteria group bacterium]MDE2226462.1 hypothetical protein [Patescibacteria group bacterium]